MGKNAGIMRVYADRNRCEIIGAEMFGPRVEHMAHLLAWSAQQRLPVVRALEMPFYHPVVEDGYANGVAGSGRKIGNNRGMPLRGSGAGARHLTADCRPSAQATATRNLARLSSRIGGPG